MAVVADDEEATAIEELWNDMVVPVQIQRQSSCYSLASKQLELALVNLRWVGSILPFNT